MHSKIFVIFVMICDGCSGLVWENTSVSEIIALLKSGHKCNDIVKEFLSRIESHNKKGSAISAVISVNSRAIEEARELDNIFTSTGNLKGALHCAPVLIKDNINV